MNTRKQVLIMSGLLMVMLMTIAVYAAWYPSRAEDAEEHFEELTAERGAILFARNCRLCHGDVGEGGALGSRLPAAPALDRPDLKGFSDSMATLAANVNATATEFRVSDGRPFKGGQTILIDDERLRVTSVNGETLGVQRGVEHTKPASHVSGATVWTFDKADLDETVKLITNTIACGRVGTAMPAWAQIHGGPLSDEQIRQLMTVITTGRWGLVKEEVDHEDEVNAKLLAPLSADTISMQVSDVSAFTAGEAIRIADERLRVLGVPKVDTDEKDKSGVLEIQRGVLGTTPFEHSTDEVIYRFPETSEPQILQQSCGQFARPSSAPTGPPELIEPFTGQTVEVVAQNVAFNIRELRVNTGGQVRVRLDNREPVQHNIAFYQSATTLTPVSPGSVGITFMGPAVDDTAFDVPRAGNYFFRCDVHPTTMMGSFIVQ